MQTTRYLSVFSSLLAVLYLSSATPSGARAEVKSLTLGISTNCPYGLAG